MKKQNDWDIIIRPKAQRFGIDFKEIIAYRDLITLFVKRDLIANYKQSVLGPVWLIMQPVLTTITFVIIFGMIGNLNTNEIPKILFYMSGIITWTFFSNCLLKTSATFNNNAHIFSKVYFPRLTVPISVVISNLFSFVIQLALFVIILFYYIFFKEFNYQFTIDSLWLLPVVILSMVMMGLGAGILISSLTTKYKDLAFMVGFGTQLLMYFSPVIFPLSSVNGNLKSILLLNPMTPIIESMRVVLIGNGEINYFYLSYSFLFGLCILILGSVVFNKVERSFTDTI